MKISQLIHRLCGITLRPGKEGLVKARLIKRLYALGIRSFEAYLQYVEEDASGRELTSMIDALTTNKTSFFREPQHFAFLQRHLVPQLLRARRPIRFWSAGCASGAEPYSLAIVLRETMADIDRRDVRILATDISTQILAVARRAVYETELLHNVPDDLLHKYFTPVASEAPSAFQLRGAVRAMVRLARLNLVQAWPMRGPFDAIFCRNVMIYFDKPTQERLVERFRSLLRPDGYLFVGHSESLSSAAHGFRYVQPAVYVK